MKEIRVNPDKLFFTSDTHAFHGNIIRWTGRPWEDYESMNKGLIEAWNSVVPTDGVVWHLGDVCFGGTAKWTEFIGSLNGRIHLVMGNHDIDASRPTLSLFESVHPGIANLLVERDNKRIWLSHFPLLTWTGIDHGAWNLHGHVHTMNVPGDQQLGSDWPRMEACSRWNQYDVGVDLNSYRPVSYWEVKKIIENAHQTALCP